MGFTLGVSGLFHDSAAAIVEDGMLVAAAEEERFSRYKHDHRLPFHAIEFCLNFAGIDIADVEQIIFFEDPEAKFKRVFRQILSSSWRGAPIRDVFANWSSEKGRVASLLSEKLNFPRSRIFFASHHEAHVASAFFGSGFGNSAFLTLDGVGENECGLYGLCEADKLRIHGGQAFPHSLGLLYSAFTEFLGFEVNEGEFKVMGLASYGEPIFAEMVETCFDFRSSSQFKLRKDLFNFHEISDSNLANGFTKLFGRPRTPESGFDYSDKGKKGNFFDSEMQRYANLAASLQAVVQDQIVDMARYSVSKTSERKLVYSGGVAFNCVANQAIIESGSVDELFVFPAAGDSGSSVGAAYLGSQEKKPVSTMYLGQEYSTSDVVEAIKHRGFHYTIFDDFDRLVDFVAGALSVGKVFGWMQGRFEFGPRALGNRSILADPRSKETQHRVNRAVKFRELFRPFAPIVTIEDSTEFFDLKPGFVNPDWSPYNYMLATANVKSSHWGNLEAVTHVDGTARVQLVDNKKSPSLHKLLSRFKGITGIPVLLNTSFNRRGEPMVASPRDAMLTFSWCNLDFLVIENILIYKHASDFVKGDK